MESQLKEFLDRLQPAAGSNLVSVVLYGSAATGEFRPGQSDLNILCLVNHADAKDLESLHAISEWWIKKGNHPPLIFTRDELNRSADVFAIELLDMKSSHRILFGPDFLTDLEVPLHLHRLQVERELRTNWLRLRQAIIAAPLTEKSHLALMTNSLSTFCSLFRHAVFALGAKIPANKREAITAAAALTNSASGTSPSNSDAAVFHQLLDLRDGKIDAKSIAVEPSLRSYLLFVESVTNEIDRRLESQ
jgi:predicted nucleotidyltransferase